MSREQPRVTVNGVEWSPIDPQAFEVGMKLLTRALGMARERRDPADVERAIEAARVAFGGVEVVDDQTTPDAVTQAPCCMLWDTTGVHSMACTRPGGQMDPALSRAPSVATAADAVVGSPGDVPCGRCGVAQRKHRTSYAIGDKECQEWRAGNL